MKTLKGLTLIELLLVFVIMGAISILGIRFYQSLKNDTDILEVKHRVDLLFSAANQYYKANCMIPYDPTSDTYPTVGINLSGRLDPRFNPPISDGATFVLSIPNDLQNKSSVSASQFLTTPYPFMPPNAITNNANTVNTFAVQFTRHDMPFDHINQETQGTVVHWNIQISVLLNPNLINSAEKAQSIKAALGANCLANLRPGTSTGEVNSCQTFSATGAYAVWEKTPSQIRQETSQFNLIHFNLIKFKSLYTVAPSRLVPIGQQNYLLCSS